MKESPLEIVFMPGIVSWLINKRFVAENNLVSYFYFCLVV
jgi:hypothetical protein